MSPHEGTAEADGTANSSTIQISTRHQRSLYTHAIQLVVSPFRNFLGRPKTKQPEGSIPLVPPRSARRKCCIQHRTVCDINIYDLRAKDLAPTDAKKRIYYFCGGGWQSPPSGQHWQLCSRMARDLPDTIISLVSYPLAPVNAAPSAFPWLMKWYRSVMQDAEEAGEKVILAGDSAGGNIVLCLILEALREDAMDENKGKRHPHPVAVLATCPSTDMTRSNPGIEKLAKHDPILTPDFVRLTAHRWIGDWDAADRRVSPVNADVSLLAKNNIRVHGITAGYDVLSPDAIVFRDLCAKAGVSGQWLHWEKQMHCFVLTAGYGVPEAKEAVTWASNLLRQEFGA